MTSHVDGQEGRSSGQEEPLMAEGDQRLARSPPNSAPRRPFPLTNDSSQCPARVAVTNPRPSTDGQAPSPATNWRRSPM